MRNGLGSDEGLLHWRNHYVGLCATTQNDLRPAELKFQSGMLLSSRAGPGQASSQQNILLKVFGKVDNIYLSKKYITLYEKNSKMTTKGELSKSEKCPI